MALELLPGGERSRVRHPVDEQHPVEVVDLVLERARGQPVEPPSRCGSPLRSR